MATITLADSDIALVRTVWGRVYEKAEDNGVLIFKTLLDKFDYYSKFPKFKDMPKDQITDQKAFRTYCAKMMKDFDGMMKNLEKQKELNNTLTSIGKGFKKQKLEPEYLAHLRVAMLEILQNTIKIAKDETEAWNKVIEATFAVIEKQL